jgi:iron(III) transport system substrate-binding protein
MSRKGVFVGILLMTLISADQWAGAAPAGALLQVIEGARKEGTVSVKLHSNFTQKSMYRLEKGIKDKYGVDLKIKFQPVLVMPKALAETIMEHNAGAVPSCDLLSLSSHIAQGMKAGVLERVDWKPLLSEGTNPSVVLDTPVVRGGLTYYTGHMGLMYHPGKVKAEDVPKTLSELANPKWKGKGGIQNTANSYVRWAFVLGKDKVLSTLKATLRNDVIQGPYIDLANRYLLGELWWCTTNSTFLKDAQDKGMPAAWQSLDFADITDFASVLVKGAPHPNAAKLVALYLASPEGAKFTVEEARAGSVFYAGNYENDISVQNRKQGIREVFTTRSTEIMEFYDSKEATQWEKEITLILQTGGGR